jgi:protein-tyrosine phosphatase
VDLRGESRPDVAGLSQHGLTVLHLPTPDRLAVSGAALDLGVHWTETRWRAEEGVYVHCQHGIGRSPLLVACVLVRLGHAPLAAFELIKRQRPCTSPSPAQLAALVEWCDRQPGVQQPLPSLEALQLIAYRHLARSGP